MARRAAGHCDIDGCRDPDCRHEDEVSGKVRLRKHLRTVQLRWWLVKTLANNPSLKSMRRSAVEIGRRGYLMLKSTVRANKWEKRFVYFRGNILYIAPEGSAAVDPGFDKASWFDSNLGIKDDDASSFLEDVDPAMDLLSIAEITQHLPDSSNSNSNKGKGTTASLTAPEVCCRGQNPHPDGHGEGWVYEPEVAGFPPYPPTNAFPLSGHLVSLNTSSYVSGRNLVGKSVKEVELLPGRSWIMDYPLSDEKDCFVVVTADKGRFTFRASDEEDCGEWKSFISKFATEQSSMDTPRPAEESSAAMDKMSSKDDVSVIWPVQCCLCHRWKRTVWPEQAGTPGAAHVIPPKEDMIKCPGCFRKNMCVTCLSLHIKHRNPGANGAPIKRKTNDRHRDMPVSHAFEAPRTWSGKPKDDMLYCSLACSGGNKGCCRNEAADLGEDTTDTVEDYESTHHLDDEEDE